MQELRKRSIVVTEAQVRYAINSGKVARPDMDGSLRFRFSRENIEELAEYFRSRPTNGRVRPVCA